MDTILRVRKWWKATGASFASSKGRRLLLGLVVGSLCAIALHLAARDSAFGSVARNWWIGRRFPKAFDGVKAYEPELIVLGGALVAALLFTLSARLLTFLRAWWAGIASLITVITVATTTAGLVEYSGGHREGSLALCVIILCTALALEYWRQTARRPLATDAWLQSLNIPPRKETTMPAERWRASTSDDPIQDWDQDIIGRTAVVELLAEHILSFRTPVIALNGDLGDGKSSTLNLLRKALSPVAIVISFNAWLPGNERTFATDLFRDIATECKKRVYVPLLRKRALVYARMITGSVSYLSGLKEILPDASQRDEILELQEVLARVPLPIVVLLDELDRMQKQELFVVLKVLRGAASMPNMTFVCAFSERVLGRSLDDTWPADYLEKFFPVRVSLAPPDPEMLGNLFQTKSRMNLREQNWFTEGSEEKEFNNLLTMWWGESISRVCTNLRKTGLLLNDILAAARPVRGEVNALDLVGIEFIRRFYPDVHAMVRTNAVFLTYEDPSWQKRQYLFLEERQKKDSEEFFKKLEEKIKVGNEPEAVRALLGSLFPKYEVPNREHAAGSRFARPTGADIAEREKRICDPTYFPIYFRGVVPQEMFSNAELEQLISDFNQAQSESQIEAVFARVLDQLPSQHPKREDFLWKVARSVNKLRAAQAEWLAYAAATDATLYAYDIMNLGEAAQALNLVFGAAQTLSQTTAAQQVLVGAMTRATDDTFARRILEYTENKDRNKILVNFSNVDPKAIKHAFMERMRSRYGPGVPIESVNLSQGDWYAFRAWAENSPEERAVEQEFWRRYIGQSRKRLAQALNFLYPANVQWSDDPRPIVSALFPLEEARNLLQDLANDEQLEEIEAKGIDRFQKLLGGEWNGPGTLTPN